MLQPFATVESPGKNNTSDSPVCKHSDPDSHRSEAHDLSLIHISKKFLLFSSSLSSVWRTEGIMRFQNFIYILCFSALKNALVSFATTPLSANSAIIFGIAIRPLKISAIVHTALTVMYGPMNTAKIYNQRYTMIFVSVSYTHLVTGFHWLHFRFLR